MIGEHNSLWSRIQAKSPHCVQVKRICYSLALCVQVAFNKLPSNLGFLLHEVPKWFSKSQVRRKAYKDLFPIMNPTESTRQGISSPF